MPIITGWYWNLDKGLLFEHFVSASSRSGMLLYRRIVVSVLRVKGRTRVLLVSKLLVQSAVSLLSNVSCIVCAGLSYQHSEGSVAGHARLLHCLVAVWLI